MKRVYVSDYGILHANGWHWLVSDGDPWTNTVIVDKTTTPDRYIERQDEFRHRCSDAIKERMVAESYGFTIEKWLSDR